MKLQEWSMPFEGHLRQPDVATNADLHTGAANSSGVWAVGAAMAAVGAACIKEKRSVSRQTKVVRQATAVAESTTAFDLVS